MLPGFSGWGQCNYSILINPTIQNELICMLNFSEQFQPSIQQNKLQCMGIEYEITMYGH